MTLLKRAIIGGLIAAAIIFGAEQLHLDSQREASAHLALGHARAVRIMRGLIADECPGGNHLICFRRQDAFVYASSAHCWRWNTGHTHQEGNNPWFFKRWYGSEGQVCHGSMRARGSYHREFR